MDKNCPIQMEKNMDKSWNSSVSGMVTANESVFCHRDENE
jgi:hypothetical protein